MHKDYYDLLVNFNYKEIIEEQGNKSFQEKIEQYLKKRKNIPSDPFEYILIPTDDFTKILVNERKRQNQQPRHKQQSIKLHAPQVAGYLPVSNKKKPETKPNDYFKKVIECIKKDAKCSESMKETDESIAEKLNIDKTTLARYKSGALKISTSVIQYMYDNYDINPDYIYGKSSFMFNETQKTFNKFDNLFNEWHVDKKEYINIAGKKTIKKYLILYMNECYYNLLVDCDFVKSMQEQGLMSYEDELKKIKAECNRNFNKNLCEYVLIPRNFFLEILDDNEYKRATLDELINYEEHFCFIKD